MPHDISYYLHCFNRLNRASVGNQKAPHKPILLLTISTLIEEGLILENHITLSDMLISRFKQIWKEMVDDGTARTIRLAEGLTVKSGSKYPFKCSIENPFYHLQNEPFWRLIPSKDFVNKSNYSLGALRKCFLYAEIDQELFELLKDAESRKQIANELNRAI